MDKQFMPCGLASLVGEPKTKAVAIWVGKKHHQSRVLGPTQLQYARMASWRRY
jgi:hypothetical protein